MKTKSDATAHVPKARQASLRGAASSPTDRWHPAWNERDLDVERAAVMRVLSMHAAPRGGGLPGSGLATGPMSVPTLAVPSIERST